MSHNGRASVASLPAIAAGKPAERDGACAAGTFSAHLVGPKRINPVDQTTRRGLRRLIEVGRMIRRSDGSYGTPAKKLITNAVAVRLKALRLAVAGFDKDIVPTPKGLQLQREAEGATRPSE